MRNIKYQNVNSYNNSGSTIANQIHIYGWNKQGTPEKSVDGVLFENVNIEGRKVSSLADKHFLLGPNVKNVEFE